MHILLVEDDSILARGIAAGLRLHGFVVDHVETSSRAEAALAAMSFDIVVLDWGLPDGDGIELLKRWRERGVVVPVLVLTARDAVANRIAGLRSGADDYVLKPFDLDELAARLHVLLRRASGRATDRIVHGAVAFDPLTGEVSLAGRAVDLSRRERALLAALLQRPLQVLTAEQLRDHVYGMDAEIESNAMNVHVHHLRRKLGAQFIETVRGVGFRLGKVI